MLFGFDTKVPYLTVKSNILKLSLCGIVIFMETTPEKFLKPYNPKDVEDRLYRFWEEGGFFNPDVCVEKGYTKADAEPFTIMMPPPNVTGVLHMGHAMMLTIEDIMIRYKRMQGFRTLWLPGTDHAAIATQSKVEKEIQKKEGKSRHDLGREELLSRVHAFAQESHDTITSQVRVMGSSCDWSREAFTLDETRNTAVNTMFKKMYDDGLIYRGHRIVNWDPKGQTTIADDEIVYEERKAKLYTFKYSKDFPISISTTRPETKVGDTAVAVHPDDLRYKEYVGKTYEIKDFCGVSIAIKIVADEAVEKDFGTGALGVTPAHSITDWEISERHNLPRIQVINEYAKMMVGDERLLGKKTTEAREVVAEWLRTEGLLEKEEEISQNVSTAERTGGIVEPLPKLQWFVAVNKEIPGRGGKTLKDLMREPVANGNIEIIPDYFNKTYFHWIDNLRDWCISRQIWYGHRVPAYFDLTKKENHNILIHFSSELISKEQCSDEDLSRIIKDSGMSRDRLYAAASDLCQLVDNKICTWAEIKSKIKSFQTYEDLHKPEIFTTEPEPFYVQDEDTLDTWFSSSLWTFSTLGWPEKTKDLETYHPTDVLETGYEILFFWVARMILMTGYALETVPFKTVYLHGTVRDAQGRKMSKSLGNGIDPLDIAEKYGADAGRMALIFGTAPGTDSKISEDKIKGMKHFANKLWNITRFVLENHDPKSKDSDYSTKDSELWKGWKDMAALVTSNMEGYRFHNASETLYNYIWKIFADQIIEESKLIFTDPTRTEEVSSRKKLLFEILIGNLKLLHPFMPFITEEIWHSTNEEKENVLPLIVAPWPKYE